MSLRTFRPALLVLLLAPLAAWPQISFSVRIGPPPLPVYEQPPLPAEGYIWTPGYWNWDPDDNDYYWVPGTWVQPPTVGYLWTPGYWDYGGGFYRWHAGYWGSRVGFYGGINYGYGYTGNGYWGGRWDRGVFNYNRSVNNVNTTVVRNVYNTTVINENRPNRVSFNGPGGVMARPTPAQERAQAERHFAATPRQLQHEHAAMAVPDQRASVNHGAPRIAYTPRPLNDADDRRPLPGRMRTPAPTPTPTPMPAPESTRPQRGFQERPVAPMSREMPSPPMRDERLRPDMQRHLETPPRPQVQPRPEVQPRPQISPAPRMEAPRQVERPEQPPRERTMRAEPPRAQERPGPAERGRPEAGRGPRDER